MESPLLALAGAVPAQGPDAGVAAHYGDPFAEQRALARSAGMVDRSHHGVLRITGGDRLSWLHSLTTQDTEHLAPGTAGPLLGFLESMRFLLRVDPVDVTEEFALLTLMGPDAARGLPDGTVVTLADSFGMDVLVARDRIADVAADLQRRGVKLAGVAAYEALRIAAHRPRLGLDTDHRAIPHEVGWIDTAVHLSKGCYRGQETVARVHNLGHPPRRLVFQVVHPGHGLLAPVAA